MTVLESGALVCPFCGAPCSPNGRACSHCGTALASVRCSHCLALHFEGARFCTRCGEELLEEPQLEMTSASCPRCGKRLVAACTPSPREPGEIEQMHECEGCGGLFVPHKTLATLTAYQERTSPPIAGASGRNLSRPSSPEEGGIHYLACPGCGKLMNRMNFGRHSGVIVDVCKVHGTWFDRDELTQALEFVAIGGLEETRRREREALSTTEREARVRMRAETYVQEANSTAETSTGGSLEELVERIFGLFR